MRRVITGIFALLFLGGVIGGAPVLLLKVAGNPLPDKVPTLEEVMLLLSSPDDGSLFLKAMALLGWLAWATFTLGVLIELPARLRGRKARRVKGLGAQQKVAGALIGAIVAVFVGASMAHASTTPGRAPVAAVAAGPSGSAFAVGPSGAFAAGPMLVTTKAPANVLHTFPVVRAYPEVKQDSVYVVQRGDYLGRISERFTGDFDRYREIAEINKNLIRNPNRIQPGWQLKLPEGSQDRGIMSHATGRLSAPQPGVPQQQQLPPPPPAQQQQPPPPVVKQTPAPPPPIVRETPPPPVQQDEVKQERQKDVNPTLAAGAGIAAASVLAAHVIVRKRRLRQTRIRVRKRRKVTAASFLPTVEVARRQMAKHRAVDRMDAGLRALALVLRDRPAAELPDIAAVWQSGGDLSVILATACAEPPEPFEERWTNTWSLPASTPIPEASFAPALLPALMTFATWPQSGELLVDAERTGLLTITGDPQRAEDLLRCLAAEAATAPWADGVSVMIAGMSPADTHNLSALGPDRIRSASSIPDALTRIGKRASVNASVLRDTNTPETMAARVGNVIDGFWATHVLFLADPWGEHTQQLRELDQQLAGLKRVGVAVVATHPTATRWSATVSSDSSLHMAWLAVAGAHARQLSADELAAQLG